LKLENDLNQDFVIEDFLDLQRPDLISQIIENQYELIANRSKLKYGGKTLAQLVKTPAKESSSSKKKKKKGAAK
jgi:hypothetical protein